MEDIQTVLRYARIAVDHEEIDLKLITIVGARLQFIKAVVNESDFKEFDKLHYSVENKLL